MAPPTVAYMDRAAHTDGPPRPPRCRDAWPLPVAAVHEP